MQAFDASKPHGTIHQGEGHDGRHFEQNGNFYDAHGKPWTPPEPTAEAIVLADATPEQLAVHPGVAELVKQATAAAVAAALAAIGKTETPQPDPAKPAAKADAKAVAKPDQTAANLAG